MSCKFDVNILFSFKNMKQNVPQPPIFLNSLTQSRKIMLAQVHGMCVIFSPLSPNSMLSRPVLWWRLEDPPTLNDGGWGSLTYSMNYLHYSNVTCWSLRLVLMKRCKFKYYGHLVPRNIFPDCPSKFKTIGGWVTFWLIFLKLNKIFTSNLQDTCYTHVTMMS